MRIIRAPVTRYLLAVLLLVVLLVVVDVHALLDALAAADHALMAVAYAFVGVSLAVNTFKWRELLRIRGIHVEFSRLLELNLSAMLYGTVLPGQLAGEAVKVVRIVSSEQNRGTFVASVLLDRVTGLVGLVIVGFVGALASGQAGSAVVVLLGVVLVATIGGLVLALLATRPMVRIADRLPQRISELARRLLEAVGAYRSHPFGLAWTSVLATAFQLLATLSILMLARAVGADVSLATLCWIFAVVSVIQLVPITIGGFGTREASLVALLVGAGTEVSAATALSFAALGGIVLWAGIGALSELWFGRGARSTGISVEPPSTPAV